MHDLPINKLTPSRPTVDEERTADSMLSLKAESSSSPVAVSTTHVYDRNPGVNDAGITLLESGIKSLNISNFPGNQKNQVQWLHSYQNNSQQYQLQQQQINLCQVQNATSPITP